MDHMDMFNLIYDYMMDWVLMYQIMVRKNHRIIGFLFWSKYNGKPKNDKIDYSYDQYYD